MNEIVASRLSHMLTALEDIRRVTSGRSLEDFVKDRDLQALVERFTERLSEASRHLPAELKDQYPHIDWRGLADIGNVLRHVYDHVSPTRLWRTVERDTPPLEEAVRALLRRTEQRY